MPRAHRYRLPGHVWHLTERCHRKQFLLKFARDRQAWIDWLYEARKRYELSVLNFHVTCNHIDREGRCASLGTTDDKLATLQNEWIAAALTNPRTDREPQWSEALAVGRRSFVDRVQSELGAQALHRCVEEVDGASVLRDPAPPYGPIRGSKRWS